MGRQGDCCKVYMSYLLGLWDSSSLEEPHTFPKNEIHAVSPPSPSLQQIPGQGAMWGAWG